MLKTTPKKKQHKKERRLPRQALQTAEQSGEGKTAARGGPADGQAKRRRKDGCPGRPCRWPNKAEKERWLPREALQTAEQSREGKMHPSECRVPKNSRER